METLSSGATVFLKKVEEYWDLPFPMKRHHTPKTKSVILQAKVIEVKGSEFRGRLFDNNGFEKDGQVFVFHRGELLANQDFKEKENLGQWLVPKID